MRSVPLLWCSVWLGCVCPNQVTRWCVWQTHEVYIYMYISVVKSMWYALGVVQGNSHFIALYKWTLPTVFYALLVYSAIHVTSVRLKIYVYMIAIPICTNYIMWNTYTIRWPCGNCNHMYSTKVNKIVSMKHAQKYTNIHTYLNLLPLSQYLKWRSSLLRDIWYAGVVRATDISDFSMRVSRG